MRALHVIPYFYPAERYGGPIASVLRLCQSVAAAGVEVEVATTDANGPFDLKVPLGEPVDVEGVRVRYFHRLAHARSAFSPGLASFLAARAGAYDLVHVTGAFSFASLVGAWASRRSDTPYVVSPRGMLRPEAIQHKAWKKQPYWRLIERRNLCGASGIHVTSTVEHEEVRAMLPGVRAFLIPNGVDPCRQVSTMRMPNRIAFLGRIHPLKGFDVLVPALARVAAARPDVETIVAGMDDEGEWRRVTSLIEKSSPRPRITYVGPKYGAEKDELLASARVFVMSSHTENFGQAAAEALAAGTPVVVSRNCPWESVQEVGAGYWVENTPEELSRALLAILDDGDLATRMGRAAVQLAQRFSWPEMGRRMALEYEIAVRGFAQPTGRPPGPSLR